MLQLRLDNPGGGTRMGHAFLSHSKHDHELALRVVAGLEAEGVPCWIAPRDIPPGSDYADALEAGVRTADVVVFLKSEVSMRSAFCRAELEIARTDDRTILPVLLDESPIEKGWRIYLSGRQWMDGSGDEDGWVGDLAKVLNVAGVRDATPAGPSNASGTEDMLRRFESYDPASNARPLLQAMEDRGWTAHVPPSREGATPPAYIRLIGPSRKRVTAYMNSAAVFAAGRHEREVFETLPSADVRSSGVYITHTPTRGGSLEQAIDAVKGLEVWAER